MPMQIKDFDDVVITQTVKDAWSALGEVMVPAALAMGATPEDLTAIDEQLELLDDGITLRLYIQLPRLGEMSLQIPPGQWAWAPGAGAKN